MSEGRFFEAQTELRKSTNACNHSYVSVEVRWYGQRLGNPANRPKNRRSKQITWPHLRLGIDWGRRDLDSRCIFRRRFLAFDA